MYQEWTKLKPWSGKGPVMTILAQSTQGTNVRKQNCTETGHKQNVTCLQVLANRQGKAAAPPGQAVMGTVRGDHVVPSRP